MASGVTAFKLFDMPVFNPNATFYKPNSFASCYKKQEQEKKKKYDEELVRRVEQVSLTPLVFSCGGGANKLT